MKYLAALVFALPLVACGEGEDDFSVDVAMPTSQVQGQLMALTGGDFQQMAGIAPLRPMNPEPGILRYQFFGDNGEERGTLQFRIEGLDGGRSRIHAALDLDAVEYEVDGDDMVVSEYRAESELENSLQSWAKKVNESGYGSLAGVDETLSLISVLMQPNRIAALENPGAFASWDEDYEYVVPSGGFAEDSGFASDYEMDASIGSGKFEEESGGWGSES